MIWRRMKGPLNRGEHVIVFESMRDVMEIELLIREFQNGPQRIQEWAQSDNATLKKKRLLEFLGSSSPDLEKNTRLRMFIRGRTEIKKSQDLYYRMLEALSRQLQKKVPSDEDITIDTFGSFDRALPSSILNLRY